MSDALFFANTLLRASRGMDGFGDDDQAIQLADQRADGSMPLLRGFGESAMAQSVAIAGLAATPSRPRKVRNPTLL